jgi:hypothetical protein
MAAHQPFPGGKRSEVGGLWSALTGLGVTRAESLEPIGEALLFGIGGGIGLGYFVYQSGETTSLFLATRLVTTETPRTGFLHSICSRLGVETRPQSASNAALAEKRLQGALETGSPVLAYVDPRRLPYPGPPAAYHAVLVCAYDPAQGVYRVIDRLPGPLSLTAEELTTARSGEGAPKFRALEVVGDSPVMEEMLREAVLAGLADGLTQLRDGFGPAGFRSNFGLSSLDKWAGLLTDHQDQRGWPKFFPPGRRLFDVLLSTYQQIEQRGAPAALRPLFAEFLQQAASILENPRLDEAVPLASQAATSWAELSQTLLPETVPLLGEARRLADQHLASFFAGGRAAGPETAQVQARLEALRATAAVAFPLDRQECDAFLEALRERVLAVRQAELDLARAVEASLPAG